MIRDKERLEIVYRSAKASLELEGFTLTKEDEKDIKDVLSGKKSKKDLINELKQKE